MRQVNWLIGRKSQLTTENKLLLYKAIIKPIWSYGIQLWGCAKPSNTKIIQRVQSKILRIVFNAPWYVSNHTLHKDSKIPFVEDEISRITNRCLHNLAGHSNDQVSQMRVHPRSQKKTAPTLAGPQAYCNNRYYLMRSVTYLRRTVVGQRLLSKCKRPTHLLIVSSKQIVNISNKRKTTNKKILQPLLTLFQLDKLHGADVYQLQSRLS
jgi:hypothetical protein